MGRTAIAVTVLAVLAGAASPSLCATASGTAAANARIVEAGVVRMNWALAQSSVTGTSRGARFTGTEPSLVLGLVVMPRNARLTVRSQDVAEGPVTAPTSFEVVRSDGENTLIVRSDAKAEVWVRGSGTLVYGALPGDSAASIGLGRSFARVVNAGGLSGVNNETLTVVVQFN